MHVIDHNNTKSIGNGEFSKVDADKAFDEFCKKYLNSSNGFLLNYYNNNNNNGTVKSVSNNNNNSNQNNKSNYYNYQNKHNNSFYPNPNMIQTHNNSSYPTNTVNSNSNYLLKENQNINRTQNNVVLRNNNNNNNNLMNDLNYYKRRNSQIIFYNNNNNNYNSNNNTNINNNNNNINNINNNSGNKQDNLSYLYNTLFQNTSNENIKHNNTKNTFKLSDYSNVMENNRVNNYNRNSIVYLSTNFNTNINNINNAIINNQQNQSEQLLIQSNVVNNNENKTINCRNFNPIKLKEMYNTDVSKEVLAQCILDFKRKSNVKNIKIPNVNMIQANVNNQSLNNTNYININQDIRRQPPALVANQNHNNNCHHHPNNYQCMHQIYSPVPSIYSNTVKTNQNQIVSNNVSNISNNTSSNNNTNNNIDNNIIITKNDEKQKIVTLRKLKSSSNSTNQLLKRHSLVHETHLNKVRSANNSLVFQDSNSKNQPLNNIATKINNNSNKRYSNIVQTKSANSIKLTLSNDDDSKIDSKTINKDMANEKAISNNDCFIIDKKKDESYSNIIKTLTNNTNKLSTIKQSDEITDSKIDINKTITNKPPIKLTKSNNNSRELLDSSQCKKQSYSQNTLLKQEAYSFVKHKLVNLTSLNNRCITPPPPPLLISSSSFEKQKQENNTQIDKNEEKNKVINKLKQTKSNESLKVEKEINKQEILKTKEIELSVDLNFSSDSGIAVNSKTVSIYEKSIISLKPESINSLSSNSSSNTSTSSASTTSSNNSITTSSSETNDLLFNQNEKIEPSNIITNIKENVFYNNEKEVSEFIAPKIEINEKVANNSPSRLGFKVFSCGMSKLNPTLPIPKDNFFLDRGDFGDDAGFFSQNMHGHAIGIADGATGNAIYGYDPGDFSRNLMKTCSELFYEENKSMDAKTLLMKAYDAVQEKTCYGSSTACVVTLDHEKSTLSVTNVGDSGYLIIRNGKIVHKSEPQRINFICPRQLDSYPWKEKSRKMGISYTNIVANQTECETIQALKDDLVIISSDGLFDNLDHSEIEEICSKSKTICDAVETLVFRSVKYYRKPDDILVLCGKVIENKTPLNQHKYTQDPYMV